MEASRVDLTRMESFDLSRGGRNATAMINAVKLKLPSIELLLAVCIALSDVYNWFKSVLLGSLYTLSGGGANRCAPAKQQDAAASGGGLSPQAPPTTLAVVVAEADAGAIGALTALACSRSTCTTPQVCMKPSIHMEANANCFREGTTMLAANIKFRHS
eukprot:scaffold130864_cov16-Tisochrysis_lutea.AAC.1